MATFIRSLEKGKIYFRNYDAIPNISYILYYEDDSYGTFNLKEFRWSFDRVNWSSWNELSQYNISNINLNNNTNLFLEVRYEPRRDANVTSFNIKYKTTSSTVQQVQTDQDSIVGTNLVPKDNITSQQFKNDQNVRVYNADYLNNKSGNYYIQRYNHIGTQPLSSVSSLEGIINNYSFTLADLNNAVSAHDISLGTNIADIDNLYNRLDITDSSLNNLIIQETEEETQDRTIYIDSSTGSDETGDGTDPSTAFQTLEKGILDIKKQINAGVTITIDLAAGDYTLSDNSIDYLNSLSCKGLIRFLGKKNIVLSGLTISEGSNSLIGNISGVTWNENQYQGYWVSFPDEDLGLPILKNSSNQLITTLPYIGINTGDLFNLSVTIEFENKTIKDVFIGKNINLKNSGLSKEEGFLLFDQLNINYKSYTDKEFFYGTYKFRTCKFIKDNTDSLLSIYYGYSLMHTCILLSNGTLSNHFRLFGSNFENNDPFAGTAAIKQGTRAKYEPFTDTKGTSYCGVYNFENLYGNFKSSPFNTSFTICALVESTSIFKLRNSYSYDIGIGNYIYIEDVDYCIIDDNTGFKNIHIDEIQGNFNIGFLNNSNTYINSKNTFLIPGVYPEEDLRNEDTLTDNAQTSLVVGEQTQNRSIRIETTIERGTSYQTRTIQIINGSSLVVDGGTPIGDSVGITDVSTSLNGDLIQLDMTLSSTGNNATMKYDIYRTMI